MCSNNCKSQLGDELVTIYVGPKRKGFTIHKEIICESDFFRGAFDEAKDGKMHLPEDNPDAFDLYAEWAYRKRIRDGHSESYLHSLYDLYIMADKFCNTKLMDATMDKIQDTARNNNLQDSLFTEILVVRAFERLVDQFENGLCKFLVLMMIHCLFGRRTKIHCNGSKISTEYLQENDLRFVHKLGNKDMNIFVMFQNNLIEECQRQTVNYDPRNRNEKNKNDRCLFHIHSDDENCREKIVTKTNNSGFVFDMSTNDGPGVGELGTKSEPGAKAYKINKFFSENQNWTGMERQEDWILTHDTKEECLYVSNAADEPIVQFPVKCVLSIESCETSSKIAIRKKAPYNDLGNLESLYCEFQDSNLARRFFLELKASHAGVSRKSRSR